MPRRKRKGKTTKKNQNSSAGPDGDKDERAKAPHSFVIHRGKTGKYVQDLSSDIRKVMEPYTATSLKVFINLLFINKWNGWDVFATGGHPTLVGP